MSEEKSNEVFSSDDLVSPCVTINRKRRFFSSINEVSPSVDLAENLEILTTSSARKSWKSTEIGKARRNLSFVRPDEDEHKGAELNRLFCKEKKISIDDGCFVASPGISSNSSSPESNSRHFSAASRQNILLFKRFASVPSSGQPRTKRSSSVCLFPQMSESNPFDGRRHSEDDKENRAFMAPQRQLQMTSPKVTFTSAEVIDKTPVLVSCFKSPTVTPKIKRVAFRNETNSRDIRTSMGKILRSSSHMMSTRCRRPCSSNNLKRQQSIDDGFFDQSFTCNEDSSSRPDLPMNFDKLFFSPVIECHEMEMSMSSKGEQNDDFLLKNTSNNSSLNSGYSSSSSIISVHTQSTFLTPSAPCDGHFERPGVGASRCLFEKSSKRNNFSNENEASSGVNTSRNSRFMTKCFSISQCRPRSVLRSESVDEQKFCHAPATSKRRRSDVTECEGFAPFSMLTKCQSELCIKKALNMDDVHQDLIGDFTKKYSLPLIRGKHQDLKSISIDTMASLLKDAYSDVVDQFTVIDCRYPYEFSGGHIKGAVNIHRTSDLFDMFLTKGLEKDGHCENTSCYGDNGDIDDNDGGGDDNDTSDVSSFSIPRKRNIIIFHCEFSSERGPKLSRFLRNKDREQNANSYPFLNYPELYLLEGGYKAFFEVHPDLCEPQGYIPMLHPNHSSDLRLFKNKSCSWLGSNKSLSKSLFNDQ